MLTTHDLSDVEKLCRRVMIIDRGELLFDGALAEIRDRFGRARELVVEFAEPYDDVAIPDARITSREGRQVTYSFDPGRVTASKLIGQLSARYRILDLAVLEPEIESIIRNIYENRLL